MILTPSKPRLNQLQDDAFEFFDVRGQAFFELADIFRAAGGCGKGQRQGGEEYDKERDNGRSKAHIVVKPECDVDWDIFRRSNLTTIILGNNLVKVKNSCSDAVVGFQAQYDSYFAFRKNKDYFPQRRKDAKKRRIQIGCGY